jgi:hypothetical protein
VHQTSLTDHAGRKVGHACISDNRGSSAQVLETDKLRKIIGNRRHSVAELIAPQVQNAQLWKILIDIVVLDQLTYKLTIGEVPAGYGYRSILVQTQTRRLG